jgi:hypothetical protein
MRKSDLNRVVFFSKDDMAVYYNLSKGEHVLNSEIKDYNDVNDILELHNIKKHIDNKIFLKGWTEQLIETYKIRVIEFSEIVGKFMSNINDSNFNTLYKEVIRSYIGTFWELFSNQKIYRNVSNQCIEKVLSDEPYQIRTILTNKALVDHYSSTLRTFLLSYAESAEIILSVYEVKRESNYKEVYLPKNLTIEDKENIITSYLNSSVANLNYVQLIINARNKKDFKVSDKTRLKAKRRYREEHDKIFKHRSPTSAIKYGVGIGFKKTVDEILDVRVEDNTTHYTYSYDFIEENSDPYSLFQNFRILFDYIDEFSRVNLVNKKNQMGVMERLMGITSESEYVRGIGFNFAEMTSHAQIISYSQVLTELDKPLEEVLKEVLCAILAEKYNFAKNVRFKLPSTDSSYIEKVRILAPEFESLLKQYKLFVEDGEIDFELLQISSTPSSIKDIPSLVKNKYLYFNSNHAEASGCQNLFFSDQTLLAYVDPFKDKNYTNFFEVLSKEDVVFDNYEEHQKPALNYLIERQYIRVDNKNLIQFIKFEEILILKDLYENEVASFHHYPKNFQAVAQEMIDQNILYWGDSLLSVPEQNYFNFFLNKSEYTNGLDLRNSYLHGTQGDPDDEERHRYSYFTYLKLLVLALLKIEDDLELNLKLNKPDL